VLSRWGCLEAPLQARECQAAPRGLPECAPHPTATELFSWATGRLISKDEAMACARRQPGRSWEAVTEKLQTLGGCPWAQPMSAPLCLGAGWLKCIAVVTDISLPKRPSLS
jgi:hypothetical protein